MTGDRETAFNRAASLLALGCMVRGNSPSDYAVWVSAESDIINRIKQHADELLHLGRGLSCSVDLSPRENEVLRELLHHRLNKEIADRLRISVRTVKFHVSSLLSKFGVGSRWDLIQKAQPMLHTKQLAEGLAALQSPEPAAPAPEPESPHSQTPKDRKAQHTSPVAHNAERRVVPFHSRLRPA